MGWRFHAKGCPSCGRPIQFNKRTKRLPRHGQEKGGKLCPAGGLTEDEVLKLEEAMMAMGGEAKLYFTFVVKEK